MYETLAQQLLCDNYETVIILKQACIPECFTVSDPDRQTLFDSRPHDVFRCNML